MSQVELRPRTVTLGLYEHVIDCTCPFGESEEFTDMLWSQGVYPDCGLMEQIAVTSWCHQGCFLGFLFFCIHVMQHRNKMSTEYCAHIHQCMYRELQNICQLNDSFRKWKYCQRVKYLHFSSSRPKAEAMKCEVWPKVKQGALTTEHRTLKCNYQ